MMQSTFRSNPFRSALLLQLAAALPLALSAGSAHAHISMTGPLTSRGGDQKSSPCDGAKGDGTVYTFEPGTTITLSVSEDIPHPSYFRIAFDDDGDDGFVEPASIKPIDPNRRCPFDADDQCGESDFCNVASTTGATVLWDNLNPHLSNAAKAVSWNVKLPDIECENCTIQVLQIMEDTVHGAYCPQGSCANAASSLEDIYHRCIDITLKRGATNSPGATTDAVSNMGMECNAGAAGEAGAGAAGAAAAGSSGSAGAASASTAAEGGSGGSGAGPTAAAGSAAPTSGSAGAKAASGGAAAPTTTTAGSAGAKAPATGSTTSPQGTAGKTASTSSAGSAAPTSSDVPTTEPAEASGGCQAAGGGAGGLFGPAVLGLISLGLRRYRRRRAA